VIAAGYQYGNGGLTAFRQPAGGHSWSRETIARRTGFAGPMLAWSGSSALVVSERDYDLDYWWQGGGTGPFHQETIASLKGP
jgi:hypothetical protein